MSMGTIPSKLPNDSFQSMKLKPFPIIVLHNKYIAHIYIYIYRVTHNGWDFRDDCMYNKYIAHIYTGLPTTDETSETTVCNLSCLFPCIHDSLQL